MPTLTPVTPDSLTLTGVAAADSYAGFYPSASTYPSATLYPGAATLGTSGLAFGSFVRGTTTGASAIPGSPVLTTASTGTLTLTPA